MKDHTPPEDQSKAVSTEKPAKQPSNVTPIKSPDALYTQYQKDQQLTPQHLQANSIKLVTALNAAQFKVSPHVIPCVIFPYHNPDGSIYDVRARLLEPKAKQKYWQLPDSGDLSPYLPQGKWNWEEVFANPAIPILIPEGEVKAIIAQDYLGEVAVMAIGGVSMWRALMRRADIIWKGRTVVVAFDHDDDQEPGHYKPQVEFQLGRFCEELMAKGAIVQCTQLGVLAKQQGIAGKVGLDDYLRQGGDPAALLTNLVSPPKGCELLAEMFERYVVVTMTKPVIWDKRSGRSYQFKPFYDLNVNKIRIDPVPNKAPREVMVAQEFVKRPDRPEATDFVLDPRLPLGYLEQDKVINTWKPFKECNPDLVRGEYKTAFGRLVETLAGEFPTQVSYWLTHYVTKPWERTSQAVLITSPLMGIAKSLVGEIIGALVGPDHYAEVTVEALKAKFNDDLEGKTWLLWNEVDTRFIRGAESWLRNLLSQETVRVEVKGGATYRVTSLRRYMMNTNDEVAIRIAQGNRRVWVCFPALNKTNEAEWKEWLWAEIIKPWREDKEAFLSSVRAWLDDVAASAGFAGYDPMSEVENGEASRELMEASMSATQSAAHHLWDMWDNSGEELLVVSALIKKQFKEVFNHLTSMAKMHGYGYGRKNYTVAGASDSYWVYSKGGDKEFITDSGSGNKTYAGSVMSKELKKLKEDQLLWVMEACSHLNQAAGR